MPKNLDEDDDDPDENYVRLALAVIKPLLRARYWPFFRSEIGRFWCAVAGVNPTSLVDKVFRLQRGNETKTDDNE